jgi:hypothetical protein
MMNKGKIAELYKQAHREHRQEYFSSDIDPTVKSVSVTRYFDHELFAQLIVRECANISNQAEKQCQHPGTQIMKHFGVEE